MPDTITLQFTQQNIDRIIRGIARPITKTKQFFGLLGQKIDNDTQNMFEGEGSRPGLAGPGWAPFSPKTLQMPSGMYRIRYGTALKPKYPGGKDMPRYKRGDKKGQVIPHRRRRYSASSKLLQAFGGFRKSFKKLKVTKDTLLYGTNLKLSERIMSNRSRNVLAISGSDEKRYATLFQQWYDRNFTI